jgi:hypothetical protein
LMTFSIKLNQLHRFVFYDKKNFHMYIKTTEKLECRSKRMYFIIVEARSQILVNMPFTRSSSNMNNYDLCHQRIVSTTIM